MSVLEKLLAPVSGDNRVGLDLDESAEVEGIRSAFDSDFKYATGLSERDASIADPKTYNWPGLLSEIEGLCDQTKDLRLAISYARCGIVVGDIEVVDRGLCFVAGLLEEYWDDFHPCGDDGPEFDLRATCFLEFTVHAGFSLPFLKMPVVNAGRATLTGEQISDVHENGAAAQDYALAKGIIDGWDDEAKNGLLSTLDSVVASFDKIQSVLTEHGGADAPNFNDVCKVVGVVRDGYVSLADLGGVDDEGDESASSVGGGSALAFSGAIRSRDDVVRAFTEIEKYYELAEPGHPVKVGLVRMRSWVAKDFMKILRDIAPDSVREAEKVLLETQDSD